jgi:hypothetical protein
MGLCRTTQSIMIGAACIFPSLLNCACTGLDAGFSAPFSPFDAKAKRKLRKWNQNLRAVALCVQWATQLEGILLAVSGCKSLLCRPSEQSVIPEWNNALRGIH